MRERLIPGSIFLLEPGYETRENGDVDLGKDSCYLISQSPTITMKRTEPIGTALEETMPIHVINSLLNPASFPILCFNLKKRINMMVLRA